MLRLNEELSFAWLAIADQNDQVLLQNSVEDEFLTYLEEAGLRIPLYHKGI
ncbi:MAG: hypothetical protein R3C11_03275 [Planctomycetaceae bacterium]